MVYGMCMDRNPSLEFKFLIVIKQLATATTSSCASIYSNSMCSLLLILIQVLTCEIISTSKLEFACCMAHIDKAWFQEYIV